VRGFPVKQDNKGVSEVVDETLIVALGLVLAVVIIVLVFGIFKPVDKTAYLVPQFGVGNTSGHTVITIYNRGGDPVYFNASPQAKYQGVLYVDTQSGSFKAVTAPTLTALSPGNTIYAYYTGSGFVLTDTLAGITFPSLPGGKITVKLVDATSNVMISQADLILAATTSTPTATTTTTTTATTTTTTTTITSTTTTPPAPLAANYNWAVTGGTTVKFTDTSTGAPTSWSWNFGDGDTSTHENINHHFATGGSYDVSLTVTRSSDGATSSITKMVTV
jgi:PKD repeat protein